MVATAPEDKPKHTKVTTYEMQEDGSIKTTTESYFEELASRKEDIIKSVKTNNQDFLSDVYSCLDVIHGQKTRELKLTISVDNFNQPSLIVKEYTIRKENFKRR